MREARRPDLAPVRAIGAVRDEVDGKLALWRFHRRIGRTRRDMKAFGEELEVMDERFHRTLHLGPLRRRELVVLDAYGPRSHLFKALPHDLHALPHLLNA